MSQVTEETGVISHWGLESLGTGHRGLESQVTEEPGVISHWGLESLGTEVTRDWTRGTGVTSPRGNWSQKP